uniref:Uncharacterized protein n=1 Tax=Anguilla anguilla TaxID=7936 RepID=A0A0E9WM08_ANGAN
MGENNPLRSIGSQWIIKIIKCQNVVCWVVQMTKPILSFMSSRAKKTERIRRRSGFKPLNLRGKPEHSGLLDQATSIFKDIVPPVNRSLSLAVRGCVRNSNLCLFL